MTLEKSDKPRMLLHACCINCMLHPYSQLKDSYEITLFFYNPNIQPRQEFDKRLNEVKNVAEKLNIVLVDVKYDPGPWFKMTEKLKDEPEGGKRCDICFSVRLSETSKYAKKENFDIFGTTLTVSPHKNSEIINMAGNQLSEKYGVPFYSADFKKKDGFKKTMQMAEKLKTYRQSYCGCIYSMKE